MSTTYLSTLAFPGEWLQRLRSTFPEVSVEQIPASASTQVPDDVWRRVDVLHTHSAIPSPEVAPRLRWVQLDTSGVDHLRSTAAWTAPFDLTSLGGIAPTSLAEYVMFSILGHAHHMTAMRQVQSARAWPDPAQRWERFLPEPLAGATVGIVGYGRIGQAISRLCRTHGMRVIGVTRSGGLGTAERRAAQYNGASPTPSVVTGAPDAPDAIYGPGDLHQMLPACDYVVVVVPLTDATRGMVGPAEVASMKRGSVFINVARGGVVDEAALLGAVRSGAVRAASLDVFDDEPLPPDSPWWGEPSVVVTPHVSGLAGDYHAQVERLVTENLRRFLAGEPLMNTVDRAAGY